MVAFPQCSDEYDQWGQNKEFLYLTRAPHKEGRCEVMPNLWIGPGDKEKTQKYCIKTNDFSDEEKVLK